MHPSIYTLHRLSIIKFFSALIAFLMCASLAHASGTTVVISQGIGSTVEGAIQNSAERALMQVVGTYVDTQTLISKRKEIKDGIKTRTKNITSETLQISNGSIKKIDVLEVVEDGNLFRVEATVEVEIDDVKFLIEPFLVAKTEVSKGLFAGISANKSQAEDTRKIITKRIIKPILSGKHIEARILGVVPIGQEVELVPTWTEKLSREALVFFPNFLSSELKAHFSEHLPSKKKNKMFFTRAESSKRGIKRDESVIVLAYETNLSQDLQNQINKILGEASIFSYKLDFLSFDELGDFMYKHERSDSYREICTFKPWQLECYVLDFEKSQSGEFNVSTYLDAPWDYNIARDLTYKTRISLLDENNSEVVADYVGYRDSYYSSDPLKRRFTSFAFGNRNRHLNISYESMRRLIDYGRVSNKALFIPYVSADLIYMKLPDEQLSVVHSLEITAESSPEFVKQTMDEDY